MEDIGGGDEGNGDGRAAGGNDSAATKISTKGFESMTTSEMSNIFHLENETFRTD